MSFHLVIGRFDGDLDARCLIVSPSLDGVDLEGATIELVYAYETSDQPHALAHVEELTETWSRRGAVHVRARPYRLPQAWPDGSLGSCDATPVHDRE